jgi:sugar lactone lactonase YvrE
MLVLAAVQAGALEIGDYGSYSFPITNIAGGGTVTLRGLELRVSNAPSWFVVDPELSILGPLDARPDETVTLRVDFRIASGHTQQSQADMVLRITSSNGAAEGFTVHTRTWRITSGNGLHSYRWTCVDERGESCGDQIARDLDAPVSSLSIRGPRFTDPAGQVYVSTLSDVHVSASEHMLEDAEMSGLSFVGISTNPLVSDVSGLVDSNFESLPLAEGMHRIAMAARDWAGNEEPFHAARVSVDGTPPDTAFHAVPPFVQLDGGLLVSSRTLIEFIPQDPVSFGVASGIRETLVSVNESIPTLSLGDFVIPGPDGPKELRWFSRDNVLNEEAVKSTTVVLDATPPSLALSCPNGDSPAFCRVFDRSAFVRGAVSDLHLASWRLEQAPGRSAAEGFVLLSSGTSDMDGILGMLGVSNPGFATLRLSAADAVENASVESVDVYIGDPARVFTLGGKEAFKKPSAVAVDASSRVYVADAGRDRIFVYDALGAFVRAYGTDGRAEPAFKQPSGVAVDGAGNVWVADTGNNRVVKLASDGSVLALVGKSELKRGLRRFKPGRGPGQFKRPAAVALDAEGNAYVADAGNRRVQVLSPEGAFLRELRMLVVGREHEDDDDDEEEEEAGRPAGIAVDGAGRVYAADREGRRVVVFGVGGDVLRTLPLDLEEPWGLAVSSEGRCLAVSDRETGQVVRLDEAGRVLLDFPAGKKPLGLAFGRRGELFVADAGARQVLGYGFPVDSPVVALGERPKHGGGFRAQAFASAASDPLPSVVAALGPAGGSLRREDKAGVEVPERALGEALELGVYAPEGELHLERMSAQGLAAAGPAVEFGPEGLVFDKRVTVALPYSGSAAGLAVHYWNPARSAWDSLPTRLEGGLARAETSHFSLYQVLAPAASQAGPAVPAAAADSTFAFRDLYVFPNPARGGVRQVIRVQVGVADSVSVNVYDVSGEQVYAGSFGAPAVLDDGNGKGPRWTYDLAWDVGGAGSGVYVYVVTAKKSGQADIKKSGRLAVLK